MTRMISAAVFAVACAAASGTAAYARQSTAAPPPAPAVSATSLINLNTASAAGLEKLPGVGPAMAARIVEYRQKNGAFKKSEELMNVKGIGEKTYLKLKPLVTVVPPKVTGARWIAGGR